MLRMPAIPRQMTREAATKLGRKMLMRMKVDVRPGMRHPCEKAVSLWMPLPGSWMYQVAKARG